MDDLLQLLHSSSSSQQMSNPPLSSYHQQQQHTVSLQQQDPAVVAVKSSTPSNSPTDSTLTEPFPDIDPILLHCSFLSDNQPRPLPYFGVALHQPVPHVLRYIVLPPNMQVTSPSSSIQPPQAQGQGPRVVFTRPGWSAQPCPGMIPPGWPFPGRDMRHAQFDPEPLTHHVQPAIGNNGFNSNNANNGFRGNNGPHNNAIGPNAPVPGQSQFNVATRQMSHSNGLDPAIALQWRRRDPARDIKRSELEMIKYRLRFTSAKSAVTGKGTIGPGTHQSTDRSNIRTSTQPAPYDFHSTSEGLQAFPTPAEVQARQRAQGRHQGQTHLQTHPQIHNQAQPAPPSVNQFPQNKPTHHQHNPTGPGQMASNFTAPQTGGMMMAQNMATASNRNNMPATANLDAMMSPTFGPSPVPVQYQQQQQQQHQQAPRAQQPQPSQKPQQAQKPQEAQHHEYEPQGANPRSVGAMIADQAHQLMHNPRSRPALQLDIEKMSRNEDWAYEYRFHVHAKPPFVDLTRNVTPAVKPVICIKNIPYAVTQNEIQQFLGKSLLPHSLTYMSGPGSPSLSIFIIMERGTGKTQDCFVELPSEAVAADCIERVENLIMVNKPPKISQRIVTVEMSSQGELMSNMFPHAKNIIWDPATGIPVMTAAVDGYSAGFRGFLTKEELGNSMRFANTPHRSPFVGRCEQRIYEMTIGTLYKFPWASIYYTVEHRDRMFNSYLNQLATLLPKVLIEEYGNHRSQRVVGLDARLVASFVDAGLACPGFNEYQKAAILDLTNQSYTYRRVSYYGSAWPFETLSKPDGVGDYEIALWIELMKVGASSALDKGIILAVGHGDHHYVQVEFDEWGQLMVTVTEEARSSVGFADVARMEEKLMKCMLIHGWEACLGEARPGMYGNDMFTLSPVEQKMKDLGAFELGIDVGNCDVQQPVSNKTDGKGKKKKNKKFNNNRTQGQQVPFKDPFHGRNRSVATDSGFGGMHRILDTQILMQEVKEMAKEVNMHGSLKIHGPAEPVRPSYAEALGSILAHTELANAPSRRRAATIKSPDGQVLNFSSNNNTNNSSANSPDTKGGQSQAFSTPHRRLSNTSTGYHDKVSPRTRTVSPKKSSSYTVMTLDPIGTPARALTQEKSAMTAIRTEKILDPIGTPSRRSMQANAVTIDDTIDEEMEEDAIIMRGRRS